MITSRSTLDSFNRLCQLLNEPDRVFYSRFGDGDIYIMTGKDESYHFSTPDLAKELFEAISINDPNYLIGLAVNYPKEHGMFKGLFAPFPNNADLETRLKSLGINDTKLYENAIFLHYLAVFDPDKVSWFLDSYVRSKRKMFIGNIPENNIAKLIGNVDSYIEVPAFNAYESINIWWPKIEEELSKVDLVIPAAGMASRVINKRLWEMDFIGNSIDIGSIVEAVSPAKYNRKWLKMKGHVLNKILIPEYQNNSTAYKFNYFLREAIFFLKALYKR